jgi:hypothetical protein
VGLLAGLVTAQARGTSTLIPMSDTQVLVTLIGVGTLIVISGAWFLWSVNNGWNMNIARLEQPDWDGLVQALGGVHIPKALKALYEDQTLIQERDFSILDDTFIERRRAERQILENLNAGNSSAEQPNTVNPNAKKAKKTKRKTYQRKYPEIKAWPIGFFYPAHPASLKRVGVKFLPKGSFAFACDMYHTYFVILSETPSDDLPVYLYFDNDNYGATEEMISPSLNTFLRFKRHRIEHGPNNKFTITDLN